MSSKRETTMPKLKNRMGIDLKLFTNLCNFTNLKQNYNPWHGATQVNEVLQHTKHNIYCKFTIFHNSYSVE